MVENIMVIHKVQHTPKNITAQKKLEHQQKQKQVIK